MMGKLILAGGVDRGSPHSLLSSRHHGRTQCWGGTEEGLAGWLMKIVGGADAGRGPGSAPVPWDSH